MTTILSPTVTATGEPRLVGGGVVLPGIVDRHPGRRTRLRQHEAAEGVNLSLVLGEGNVVRSERHRFFLRPFVGRRIVFVHHADRLPSWREPAEDVHLAVCRGAEQLFRRLGERSELRPLPLSESPARPNQTGERNPHSAYESHGLLLPWILYYKPARFLVFTARFTTFMGHSPESTRRTSPGAPA